MIQSWKLSKNKNSNSGGINLDSGSLGAGVEPALQTSIGVPFGSYYFAGGTQSNGGYLVTASNMPMNYRFINMRFISNTSIGVTYQSFFGRTSNIAGNIWITRNFGSNQYGLTFQLHSGTGTTTRTGTSLNYFNGHDGKYVITHIILDINPLDDGIGIVAKMYRNSILVYTAVNTSVTYLRPAYNTIQYVGSWATTQYYLQGNLSNFLIDYNSTYNWTEAWIRNDYMSLKNLL